MIIVGERIYKDKLLETNFLPLTFDSLSEAMLATVPFEHWVIYQKNLNNTFEFIREDI